MNAELLANYFKEPHLVNTDGIKDLEDLCKTFPYFALPNLILAKIYKTQNHYRYNDALKTAALMAPSREWLYTYLEGEMDVVSETGQIESIEIESESEIELTTPNEPISEVIEVAVVADISELPAEKHVETGPVSQLNMGPSEEVDKEIIEEPIEIEIPKIEEKAEIVFDSEIEIKPEENPPKVINKFDHIPEYHIEDFFKIADGEEEGSKSFFDWLKNPVYSETSQEDIEPILKENKTVRADPMDLIEKFLVERPSISRPKVEFFNPANVAKKAEELHPDLVTETLANLFYKQGSYDKALYAFEILCLKIPEKRHYFVTLIQKIKEEQTK